MKVGKKLHKLIAGAATGALVLGTLATGAFAASPTTQASAFNDTSSDQYATAINAIAGLGISNGFPDGGYHPTAAVTREEFAKFVVQLLGDGNLANAVGNVTPNFTDGSKIDTWAYGYVNLAQSLGLIKGYPDGSFQPQKSVSEAEAVAMLVRAMGGERFAQSLGGGWPGSYLAAATQIQDNPPLGTAAINILSGVTLGAGGSGVAAQRDELAQMLYNAGQVKPTTYDANGNAQNGGNSQKNPLFNNTFFASDHGACAGTNFNVTTASTTQVVILGPFGAGCANQTKAYTVASNVTINNGGDTNIADLQGDNVDFALNASGSLAEVSVISSSSNTLTLNTNTSLSLQSGLNYVTNGAVIYPYLAADGNNFVYLVKSDGTAVKTTAMSNGLTPYQLSVDLNNNTANTDLRQLGSNIGGAGPLDGSAAGWGWKTDTFTANLDNNGSINKLTVNNVSFKNLLVTNTAGVYDGTDNVTVTGQSNPGAGAAMTFALSPSNTTDVTLNGKSTDLKTAYSAIQSDLNKGVFPVVNVYDQNTALGASGDLGNAGAATDTIYGLNIADTNVSGTVTAESQSGTPAVTLTKSDGSSATLNAVTAPADGSVVSATLNTSPTANANPVLVNTHGLPSNVANNAAYTFALDSNGGVAYAWQTNGAGNLSSIVQKDPDNDADGAIADNDADADGNATTATVVVGELTGISTDSNGNITYNVNIEGSTVGLNNSAGKTTALAVGGGGTWGVGQFYVMKVDTNAGTITAGSVFELAKDVVAGGVSTQWYQYSLTNPMTATSSNNKLAMNATLTGITAGNDLNNTAITNDPNNLLGGGQKYNFEAYKHDGTYGGTSMMVSGQIVYVYHYHFATAGAAAAALGAGASQDFYVIQLTQ